MPGPGGPRVILGVGFWAQQEYFGILPGPDGTKIFRPILKSLPDQPPPPNAFQSWTWSYNLNLIGQDQMIVGEQRWELPPSQTPYELTRNFTWQWNTPLSLYFQAPGQPLVGAMWDVLPPAHFVPYRIDQTWTWSYNKNLIGQDKLPTGEQVYDRPALPVSPTFTYTYPLQPQLVVRQPFNQYDWPVPRAYFYNIDIASITRSYNLNLIGQDKLPVGEVVTETPRQPAPQPPWTQPYNVALYFVPPFVDTTKIFRGHLRSLPDQGPPRLDQTWTRSVNLNLIAPPPDLTKQARQQDWPVPRGVEPDWRRSWTFSYNLDLLGQDKLPIGKQTTDLAPIWPPYINHLRTWAWWYQIGLIGQDQLPFRQQDWPLTPAAQRAADLGTWIDRTKFILLRPFFQTDWPNPTQPFRDPTLATVASGYNLDLIGQDRLPNRQQDWPLSPAFAPTLLQSWTQPTNIALLIPVAQLPPGVFYHGVITERPQLRTEAPPDLYTITHARQIPQPTPTVTPAVYNKPFFAGPGYLDVIPGEKPS
jgi:hypothetical protein